MPNSRLDTSEPITRIPDSVLDNTDEDIVSEVLNDEDSYQELLNELNETAGTNDADILGGDEDGEEGDEAGGGESGAGEALSDADRKFFVDHGVTVSDDGLIDGRFKTPDAYFKAQDHKKSLIDQRLEDLVKKDPDLVRSALEESGYVLKDGEGEAEGDAEGDAGTADAGTKVELTATEEENILKTAKQFAEQRVPIDDILKDEFEGKFKEKELEYTIDPAELSEIEETDAALVIRMETRRKELEATQETTRQDGIKMLQFRKQAIEVEVPKEEESRIEADKALMKERFGFDNDDVLTENIAELQSIRNGDDLALRDRFYQEAYAPGSNIFVMREHALYDFLNSPDRDVSTQILESVRKSVSDERGDFYANRRVDPNAASIEGSRSDKGNESGNHSRQLPTPEQMHSSQFVDTLDDAELTDVWDSIDQLPSEERAKYNQR